MTNCYLPVLEKLQEAYGGSLHKIRHQSKNHRSCWHLIMTSKAANAFLKSVHPYLTVKAEQVEVALDLQKHIDHFNGKTAHMSETARDEIISHRFELADRMSHLKRTDYAVEPITP